MKYREKLKITKNTTFCSKSTNFKKRFERLTYHTGDYAGA